MTEASGTHALAALSSARKLVQFLSDRQDIFPAPSERSIASHMGAALADSVLQAGLNYETVVLGRVNRIIQLFPEAATISGTIDVLSEHGPSHFLSWSHPHKIVRFTGMLCHLHEEGVESCTELYVWLNEERARKSLLSLKGVGPKTVDYLCTLVGIDCVAVDRHVRQLSRWAGVEQTDYLELKLVVSYAADLIGMPRRQFDWWLWRVMSQASREQVVGERLHS